MIQGIGRYLQGNYLLFFFLLIVGIAGTTYYFWNSGLANGHHVAIVYETSAWLDELQKNNYLNKIESQVKQGKVRMAYQGFDRLDKKVRDINRVKPLGQNYDSFRKDMAIVRDSMDKLVAFPEVSKIYHVLIGRLSKFDKFVTHNNWKTLSRTSSRILAKLNNLTGYSFPKIANINRIVFQDITIMKTVTDSSVLSKTDKRLINERLKVLRTEVVMLEKYIETLRSFLENSKNLKKSYHSWVKRIAPEISLEKTNLSKKSKEFSLLLLGLLSFSVILFFGSVLIYRRNIKQTRKQVEEYALDLVKNKILMTGPTFNDESDTFQQEFKKTHQYLHKRMSFGSMFQEAFPFAAVLLDSNLKVVWSNREFCDRWGISKTKLEGDSINWDYIGQLTNLGETDPVFDAMQGSLSGIYQIQVKALQSTDRAAPYEMYVNPLEYLGQKRVMIFFYPLSSLEQTITDQAKSITAPIKKSLEALITRNFFGNALEKARDEFFSAGIDHLFDRFQALEESLRMERKGYLKEIERVEDEVEFYQKIFSDIQKWGLQMRHVREEYCRRLVDLKGGVITLSENVKTQYLNGENIITNAREVMGDCHKVIDVGNGLYENIQRGQKAIDGLGKLRDIFKKMTNSIEESRYKLHQSLDQVLIFNRMGKIEGEKLCQGVSKLKTDVKAFDATFEQLLKSIRTLDIVLSKMGMIIEQDKLSNRANTLQEGAVNFNNIRREFDALVSNSKNISAKMVGHEEKVVSDLKRMYDAVVQMGHFQKGLEEILTKNKTSQIGHTRSNTQLSI